MPGGGLPKPELQAWPLLLCQHSRQQRRHDAICRRIFVHLGVMHAQVAW